MSTNVPPPTGAAGPPQAPVAVQQTTVVQMGTHKNVALAVILAFLFGPLGMLYATVAGGIVMLFVNIVVAALTLGLGLFLTIPLGMAWAGIAASSHNAKLGIVATQQAVGSPAAAKPTPPPVAAQQLPATVTEQTAANPGAEEEVTVVLKSSNSTKASCTSCGSDINPRARFCSACGQAQATT